MGHGHPAVGSLKTQKHSVVDNTIRFTLKLAQLMKRSVTVPSSSSRSALTHLSAAKTVVFAAGGTTEPSGTD